MSVMTDADTNKGAIVPAEAAPAGKGDKPSIVELRNGKLVLKQKILSFEKMSETMQEIVKFREMLEQRLEAKEPPLTSVPDEHKPVIAKLVHESDKTLQALSKHVQEQLLPAVDEDEEDDSTAAILPLSAVEDAIKSVAKRVNYGLDSPADGVKVPAAWLIWRWEVVDECRDWLPKNAREKVDNRLRERQQAKKDVKALFDALPEAERVNILGPKPGAKPSFRIKPGPNDIPGTSIVDLTDSTPMPHPPPLQPKSGSENGAPAPVVVEDGSQDGAEKKGPGRPKKPLDPEKAAERAAKEKERLEKKAAKAEREKKEQAAQAKSRSLMASFFGKAKPSASSSSSPAKSKSMGSSGAGREGSNGSPAPVQQVSEFERTFRPFALKKDAELAPANWFRERKERERRRRRGKGKVGARTEGNVIVIDDDEEEDGKEVRADEDVEMADAQEDGRLDTLSPQERLRDILSRLPPGLNPPRRPSQPTGYKTYSPLSVRGLIAQLTEAEVAGDDTTVRRLLALLRSRRALPAKVLVFAEDARPGYFGTFTRSSREVGPRTPFARDVVAVDYGYDSGAEWAEEDSGEADDVVEGDGEEEDGEDGEEDSDLDSWLVDDDEVEDPGTPIEERMGSPGFDFPPLPGPNAGKRKKEEKERHGASKKRRVIVPLVPFAKGPEWEPVIGRCKYEPFNAYRIQLFNDTPFPIDPFTFVSQPVEQPTHGPHSHQTTADGFVIPPLPPHIAQATNTAPSSSSSSNPLLTPGSSSSAPTANPAPGAGPKRNAAAPKPKTPFPDAHLPHLLARIEALATSSLQCIVETVHRELLAQQQSGQGQGQKVKKNAIEAKVREVGEKCRERKVWVVRAEVKAQHGMT
ncbi:hypothetical protein OH77DRAFT_1499732 [Trametes cingulata]|nr:hypothetical protein OH77DRAFT_1499732 [Trametes cingulata]